MNEISLNLTDTEELRTKHEKLWFDVILRMLEESIRVNSSRDLSLLKCQFFIENDIPFNKCYLSEVYPCYECPLLLNGNICQTLYNHIGDYNFFQQIVICICIATCFLELEGATTEQCLEYAFNRLREIGANKPTAMLRLKELESLLKEKGAVIWQEKNHPLFSVLTPHSAKESKT